MTGSRNDIKTIVTINMSLKSIQTQNINDRIKGTISKQVITNFTQKNVQPMWLYNENQF